MKHKIGIVGLGFVGTAVESGFQAIPDIQIHIYDKFKPSDSIEDTVNKSEVLFICLPTPMNEDGSCNISIIENEIENIVAVSEKTKTIVIKSTVPPGTTDKFQEFYPEHTFIFNPEFLREKSWYEDFMYQDRIILGTPSDLQHNKNVVKVIELYNDFNKVQKVVGAVLDTRCKTAEMVKYIANCFLSTKVMFFNEIHEICQAGKINFEEAVELACLDKRINNSHTKVPGHDGNKGFGGSCFPKDINALMAYAKELDLDPMLLETVWTKNILVRENYDWEKLAQVTGDYEKK